MVFPLRLKKRAQFLKAARRGKKTVYPGLVSQALPAQEEQPEFRAGFTVTKKVGNSVVRNRTRRRLREALRLVAQERGVPSGHLVLIGRVTTQGRPFEALKQDVRKALRQLENFSAPKASEKKGAAPK